VTARTAAGPSRASFERLQRLIRLLPRIVFVVSAVRVQKRGLLLMCHVRGTVTLMPFRVALPVRSVDGCTIVVLPVEIRIDNASVITDALLAVLNRGASYLIMDMTGTSFCDAAGMRAVRRAYSRAQCLNADVRAVVCCPDVRKIFTIAGSRELMPVYATVEEALRQFGHPDT
jgi:anti-sigma B factor antagonist